MSRSETPVGTSRKRSSPRPGSCALVGHPRKVPSKSRGLRGFQSAFLACGVLAGIGLALALLLLGRPRQAPQERLEPVPATGAAE
jgi:hypothetical protein